MNDAHADTTPAQRRRRDPGEMTREQYERAWAETADFEAAQGFPMIRKRGEGEEVLYIDRDLGPVYVPVMLIED